MKKKIKLSYVLETFQLTCDFNEKMTKYVNVLKNLYPSFRAPHSNKRWMLRQCILRPFDVNFIYPVSSANMISLINIFRLNMSKHYTK